MDFGLLLGLVIVVAVIGYIWMGRENNKMDGLDETFPSDCSVDTKPDVINPAKPAKAEPVFAKSVLAPEAVVEEKVVTVQSDPLPVEQKAQPTPSAAQQLETPKPAPSAVEDAAVAKAEAAAPKPKAPKPKAAKPKAKAEDAVTRETLEALTKKQIDELAAKRGVKLDRRQNKRTMIDTFLKSV